MADLAPASGGRVLDRECGSDRWNGDLRNLVTWTWREESDVAALAIVTVDGQARIWMNVRHANHQTARLIWMWGRHAAAFRPPDILYADELARLATGEDAQAQEA